jgi:DNA-binding protein YbaB
VDTPYDKEIEQLLAQYQRQRSQLGEFQQAVEAISGTATAANRAVRATVNAHGELTDLAFLTKAYRTMPPTELAVAIRRTVEQARTEATRSMREVLKRFLGDHSGMIDLSAGVDNGFTDWASMLPAEPLLPEQVARYARRAPAPADPADRDGGRGPR